MKRTARVSLVLMLVLALTVMSVQALPPGLQRMMERNQEQNQEETGYYGPGRELPPGLRGKGTPPGLEKQGLELPPGLIGREVLPPGIMMRFVDAMDNVSREYWEDQEADSITVEGPRYLAIPPEEVKEVQYRATVQNEHGRALSGLELEWELDNGYDGISIDQKGVLTVTDRVYRDAYPDEIKISAIYNDDLDGSLEVKLIEGTSVAVDNLKTLKDELDDDSDIIRLEADIRLDEPLVISRDVIIDGMGYKLTTHSNFKGWMITIEDDVEAVLENLVLDGGNRSALDGLVKVEDGASLDAMDNYLRNAPVGFGIWDEDDENVEDLFLDQNRFSNVTEKVVFYD